MLLYVPFRLGFLLEPPNRSNLQGLIGKEDFPVVLLREELVWCLGGGERFFFFLAFGSSFWGEREEKMKDWLERTEGLMVGV